jgi:hypothetical protein
MFHRTHQFQVLPLEETQWDARLRRFNGSVFHVETSDIHTRKATRDGHVPPSAEMTTIGDFFFRLDRVVDD